jgi:hypothetical protein
MNETVTTKDITNQQINQEQGLDQTSKSTNKWKTLTNMPC